MGLVSPSHFSHELTIILKLIFFRLENDGDGSVRGHSFISFPEHKIAQKLF